MYYIIYKIRNKIINKIYIGSHKTDNLDDNYMGSGKILHRAYKKYGIENFQKEILFIFDNLIDMMNKEKEIVNEEFIKRKDTYNIKLGGSGGFDYINSNRLNIYGKNGQKEYGGNNLLSGKKAIDHIKKNDIYDAWRYKISTTAKEQYKRGRVNGFKDKEHTSKSKAKIGKKSSKHQSGSGNSQYGSCWIYNKNLKKNMKISRSELQQWIKTGWNIGRKMNF